MNFNEATILLLSGSERDTVLQKLTTLRRSAAIGERAVDNIQKESRLPRDAWDALFRMLLAAPDDAKAVKRGIADCFCNFTLRGDPLPTRPVRLGRAVDFQRVVGWYADVRGIPESRARQFFKSYFDKGANKLPRRWSDFPLARYLMWCMFHPSDTKRGPFDGMPSKAWDIRCRLGLSAPLDPDEEIVLLEYGLPHDVQIRFPTVADAYAGQGWAYHFQVAPEANLASPPPAYGSTLPWKKCEDKPGRPEAVHEVIRGRCLNAPLRLVS